jgi:hypothetical protein
MEYSSMRTKIRLVMVAVAAVAALSVAGYTFGAGINQAFAPAGVTRYAMVQQGPTATATTTSTSFVNMPGMSVAVAIPSGKAADLIVTFSAMVNSCFAMQVRATVDGSAALPSSTQFFWQAANTGADSRAFTFFQQNVGAGSHTVRIQWAGVTSCSSEFVAARSMVVTANIH